MELVISGIEQYGYLALFALLMLGIAGLPIPDETILTFAGYLVFKDRLALIPTMLVAFLGSVTGITLSYGIGYSLGRYVVSTMGRAFNIRLENLDQVNVWYARWGKYALLFGYFVPGIRHLTALAAGSSKLPLTVFMPFAYTGGLLWSGTFVAIGYLLGEEWAHTSAAMHRLLMVVTGFALLTVTLLLLYRKWRSS